MSGIEGPLTVAMVGVVVMYDVCPPLGLALLVLLVVAYVAAELIIEDEAGD